MTLKTESITSNVDYLARYCIVVALGAFLHIFCVGKNCHLTLDPLHQDVSCENKKAFTYYQQLFQCVSSKNLEIDRSLLAGESFRN